MFRKFEKAVPYMDMVLLVCISAAIACGAFVAFVLPHIRDKVNENSAEKYKAELIELVKENETVFTEYAKRELKLQKESGNRYMRQIDFDKADEVLGIFDYGWVSYNEPTEEIYVLFCKRKSGYDFTIIYSELPYDYGNEQITENIYISMSEFNS